MPLVNRNAAFSTKLATDYGLQKAMFKYFFPFSTHTYSDVKGGKKLEN
jgi:hypothetical protein